MGEFIQGLFSRTSVPDIGQHSSWRRHPFSRGGWAAAKSGRQWRRRRQVMVPSYDTCSETSW